MLHIAVVLAKPTSSGAIVAFADCGLFEGAFALWLFIPAVACSTTWYCPHDTSFHVVLGLWTLEFLKEPDAQCVVVVQTFDDFTIPTKLYY